MHALQVRDHAAHALEVLKRDIAWIDDHASFLFHPMGDPNNAETIDGSAEQEIGCLLYTSPSPRDRQKSRMPSSA